MVVINGSYGERRKWVEGAFTPTFNCHVSCKGSLQKKKEKEAQHAKKTRTPKSSRKVEILKGGKGKP